MNKIEKFRNKQAGVTLLLAILILSSVLAISFSLSAVLFVEIRNSGDLVRTEPAIYGANAISEEALFKVKRQVPSFVYSSLIGNVKSVSSESALTEAVQQIKVAASSNTFANTVNSYPIYTVPSEPNSDYGKIDITYPAQSASNNLDVYVCEFDLNPNSPYPTSACTNPSGSQGYWGPTVAAGGGVPYSLVAGVTKTFTLDSNKQQQLILVNSGGYNDLYVQVTTYDKFGNPRGLPYFGQTSVSVTSSLGGVSRKIQIITPNPSATANSETVWADDSVPLGATLASDGGDSWNWVSSNPSPQIGSLSSQSNIAAGEHQHYFVGATTPLAINTGDAMIAYVYIDSLNIPSEIELQWYSTTQGWNHRGFWSNSGIDQIGFGNQGTNSLRYMDVLPVAGQWVKLTVPASQVGLEGLSISGMAFTLYGGSASWDHAGKTP